jgi:hypothetical protein
MVLKIMDRGNWWLSDRIENLRYPIDSKMDEDKCISYTQNGLMVSQELKKDQKAYVLSDDGKTIERIN